MLPVIVVMRNVVKTEEQQSGLGADISARAGETPSGMRRQGHILTISLIGAILLFILDSTFGISDAILSRAFPPGSIAPASNLFYFQALPFSGTITLDGQRLTHLPSPNTENPLQLTKGVHLVVWKPAPFPTMTCRLSVPPTTGAQNCPTHLISYPNNFTPSALVVTPPRSFSLLMLPPALQQALMIAVQAQLDTLQGSDRVRTGERYQATANPASLQLAIQPLQATLRFVLDTNTSQPAHCQGITLSNSNDASCFIGHNDCRSFCTLQWPTSGAQTYWDVAVIVRAHHTYVSQAPPHIQKSWETQQFVALRIAWDGQKWSATFHQQGDSFFDDPGCHALISTLVTDSRYQNTFSNHWAYISGNNRAQGCVAVLQPNNPAPIASPLTNAQTILFERFGVLLTASTAAANKWPYLPEASVYERTIAQTILRNPAFVS